MAKVIKLQNGTTTLLPITDSSYVQYKTVNNTFTSVKSALDQLSNAVGGNVVNNISDFSTAGLKTFSYTIGETSTNVYTPIATNSALGVVKGGTTSGKTYGVSIDANGAMTVNVPWENDNYYNVITSSSPSGLKIADIDPDNGTASTNSDSALYVPIAGSTLGVVKSGTTSGKTYGVSIDANGAMTVDVPWTDTVPDYSNTYAPKTHEHTITWSADSNYTPATDTVNVLTYFNSATTLNNNGTAEYTTATVPTKKYVDEIVTNIGSALSFCGKVDGSHALPTINLKVGMTYLVGSAGEFGGQTCEPGDMLISYYDTAYHWAVVQANWTATDGTTNVTVGDATATTLATIGGVNIDVKVAQEANVVHTSELPNNFSSITVNANSTAVTDILSTNSAAVTVTPASSGDSLTMEGANKWIHVKGTDGTAGNDKIQFTHAINPTGTSKKATTSGNSSLTHDSSLVITGISYSVDAAGHIENITATTGKLPALPSTGQVVTSMSYTANVNYVEGNSVELDNDFLEACGVSSTTADVYLVDSISSTTSNSYYHS